MLSLSNNRDNLTEAHAYVGMDLLITLHHDEALEHLRWVIENGNRSFIEYINRTDGVGPAGNQRWNTSQPIEATQSSPAERDGG